MSTIRRWSAVLLALTAAQAAGTTVYKWVDEDGVLHLEQRPRPLPPLVRPDGGVSDARIDSTALTGRWQAQRREELVTLSLAPDGSCVWQVELRGVPWSRQPGSWRLVDNGLEIRTRLGRTRYRLEMRANDTITLVRKRDGARWRFTR